MTKSIRDTLVMNPAEARSFGLSVLIWIGSFGWVMSTGQHWADSDTSFLVPVGGPVLIFSLYSGMMFFVLGHWVGGADKRGNPGPQRFSATTTLLVKRTLALVQFAMTLALATILANIYG